MWVFLTARFRRFVLFSIALPLVAALARRVADALERQHGRTRTSRALRAVAGSATSRGRRRGGRRGR